MGMIKRANCGTKEKSNCLLIRNVSQASALKGNCVMLYETNQTWEPHTSGGAGSLSQEVVLF